MSSIGDHQILIFLIQIFLLLTIAKILGETAKKLGVPALVGEILTGILIGATLLGRLFPEGYQFIFPQNIGQDSMLDTVALLGILFLLLTTGFEVNVSSLWKQGSASLRIGVTGVLLPVIIGFALFWLLPDKYFAGFSAKFPFVLLLAYTASISGTPIISKIMHDLKILKTDVGLTIILAYVVNEVLGWFLFTIVFGILVNSSSDPAHMASVFFQIILFGIVCITMGSRFLDWILRQMKRSGHYSSAMVLTIIFIVGIMCGTVTQWIGINAILGFFLAGIIVGNTTEITENHRTTISQIVHAAFVPLFFATLALRIDFIKNADLLLMTVFTVVAMGSKFVASGIGARWAKMSKKDSLAVAVAHIPGGSVDLILASVALKLKLISEPVFVAIIFGAMVSALFAGPLLAWAVKLKRSLDVKNFFPAPAVISDLKAHKRFVALDEICDAASTLLKVDMEIIKKAVREREEIMGTGMTQGLAIPHGRIPGLQRPLLFFARSKHGLEWDTPDGLLTHFIFLILTPEEDSDIQVQLLALIARSMLNPAISRNVMHAGSAEAIYTVLLSELERHAAITV